MYGAGMVNSQNHPHIDDLVIRLLNADDPPVISGAFSEIGWNKPVAQYERYLLRQVAGSQEILVAEIAGKFAGYVTVLWRSGYASFAERKIPEINDFNVLPAFRRRGIGSGLLDRAEEVVAERSDVVGIGVGMTADYGQAQRMYPRRGYVPDGRGLTQDGEVVKFRQPIVVSDSTVLWFTKNLR